MEISKIDDWAGERDVYAINNNYCRVFYIDDNGEEIEKDRVIIESINENIIANDILPNYLKYGLRLCNTKLQWLDDDRVGGICMSYNHDYREVFLNEKYWEIKEFEDNMWKLASVSKKTLTDIAFVDLDDDGKYETIEGFCEYGYGSNGFQGNNYDVYIEKENDAVLVDHFWDAESPMGLIIIKFGKKSGVLVGRNGSHQSNGYHTNLITIKEDGTVKSLVTYDDEYGAGDDDSIIISADKKGNAFLLAQGDMAEDTPLPDWDKDSFFYISYLNDEFIEYDSVEISYDELTKLDNASTAIIEAEKYIDEYIEGYNTDYKDSVSIMNVLYSSNDMIYINYDLKYGTDSSEYDYMTGSLYCAAVFYIENGKLTFSDCEIGKRLLTSGENIKSYIIDFPY